MFAFRHDEMVNNPKHLAFLRSLQFNTIVTCQLNPLRVCLPPVVKNFAALARNYQVSSLLLLWTAAGPMERLGLRDRPLTIIPCQ
jgi:hypothetical protein